MTRSHFPRNCRKERSIYNLGLGFWTATVAAPGTIEGMVYVFPFITPYVHLAVQPENHRAEPSRGVVDTRSK